MRLMVHNIAATPVPACFLLSRSRSTLRLSEQSSCAHLHSPVPISRPDYPSNVEEKVAMKPLKVKKAHSSPAVIDPHVADLLTHIKNGKTVMEFAKGDKVFSQG